MTDPRKPARCPGPFGVAPTRRDFLRTAGNGFGLLGLSYLLQKDGLAATGNPAPPSNPMAAKPGHFPARRRAAVSSCS